MIILETVEWELYCKVEKKDGLDGEIDIRRTLPSQLGALSNSKRIMNNFIREINGFYISSVYYGDTDSLYKEKKLRYSGQSWFMG